MKNIFLILAFFVNLSLHAAISDPDPIYDATLKYESHANYITVTDPSGKMIWKENIYETIEPIFYTPYETDSQWNIISQLTINGDELTVKTSNGSEYYIDKNTGQHLREGKVKLDFSWIYPLLLLIFFIAIFVSPIVFIVRKIRQKQANSL